MTENKRVRVNLCPTCAQTLRELQQSFGNEGMAPAAMPVIARCQHCSTQLPAGLVASILAGETIAGWKGSGG